MSGNARPAGWMLRAICLLGAAAMAAVGAFLFEPALVDLGLYLERGKYALAGYTLIYGALLVAFAATAGAVRTRNVLANYSISLVTGPVALFALGFLFAALAADAFFYRDPPNLWVALLAAPAVLCFVAASLSQFVDGPQTSSGTGRSTGTLARIVVVTFYFVLALAAAVAYVNIGYLLFYLLQANLLDGNDIDVGRIGPALVTVLHQVAAERWQFVLIVGAAGAFLIYSFTTLFAWAAGTSSRASPRPLAPEEAAFVERCAQELRAYAEAMGYSPDAKRLLGFVVLPSLFVPLLIAAIVGINLHNWVPRPYDPEALAAAGWHVYERSAGFSAVAMLFAALFWSVLPNAILARISRGYSEMAGWASFASDSNTIALETILASLLRAGKLSLRQTLDPGRMLHYINTVWEPLFMYPAVLFTFVAAIAWHHDMSRYHVLTDRHVEVMEYWTLERHRYPYTAVRGVEIACTFDDGRPSASYEIALPDGFSVVLFDKRNLADHAGDLARVDALVPASVPRAFATHEGQSAYDPLCVEALAATLAKEDAGRLRTAFRTEVWHRARWQERIGAAK